MLDCAGRNIDRLRAGGLVLTDLNLLRTLDALLETGSVTAAGHRLHLSPSAVSRSLSRLRRALDDPLFVMVGREFQPTPRALELRGATSEALAAAEAVLQPSGMRDPRHLRRTFTISADDALTAGLAGLLAEDVASQAPGVTLRFITDDHGDTALDTGTADLDLGIAPEREHLESEALFTDRFVLAAHPDHPIHRARSMTSGFARSTYVVVARNHQIRQILADRLPTADRSVEVPSYLAAVLLVAGSPTAVAVLPSLLVGRATDVGSLRARRLPFDVPEITVSQSWHRRHDADPAHRWLRARLRLLARTEE